MQGFHSCYFKVLFIPANVGFCSFLLFYFFVPFYYCKVLFISTIVGYCSFLLM